MGGYTLLNVIGKGKFGVKNENIYSIKAFDLNQAKLNKKMWEIF